ncbi:MAG: hypothetical protein HKN23_02785 [Verrucomicrobiales bacterium]|nr:hypothetical protein [Verrucomicrobiales bacterium]
MEEQPPPSSEVLKHSAKWPINLGIVIVIFGIFGILAGGGRIMMGMLYAQNIEAVEMETGGAQFEDFMAESQRVSFIQGTGSIILAVLLLIGGVLLAKTSRISSIYLQTWSYLKIIAGGGLSYLTFQLTRKMMSQAMVETAGDAPVNSAPDSMITLVTSVQYVIGLAWIAALPIFLLIWFNRDKIRSQTEAW